MSYYTPKSEEQLSKEGLLPEGEYDFEVADCIDKPSKKGSPMYNMKLHVFDDKGRATIINDYIVFGSNYGERKFRHAAYGCGLGADYEAQTLTNTDFVGKVGKVQIAIKESDDPDYPLPKNEVKDYLKSDGTVIKKTVPKTDIEEDQVPF